MKHTKQDLLQMQSLPLAAKVRMTERRIREWYEHWEGQVYVSFSGGKDSTVLKHIVDSMYDDVPAVFVNTGLEYPEIQSFVREIKSGKYDCFNTDIEIIRPEMRFDEVIERYGYPVPTKSISKKIEAQRNGAKWADKYIKGEAMTAQGNKSFHNCKNWAFLVDAPFRISNKCCDIMKKKPFVAYEKETNRVPYIGIMASEGMQRERAWMQNGCNAFESKKPKSQPLSFWTEQDILEYIVRFNVPYASVYGLIQEEGQVEGQMYIDGCHNKLCTSGVSRTGCMFCMFGAHLEKEPNRFQRMKHTHPKQYEYCMNQLGLKEVLEYINVKYE